MSFSSDTTPFNVRFERFEPPSLVFISAANTRYSAARTPFLCDALGHRVASSVARSASRSAFGTVRPRTRTIRGGTRPGPQRRSAAEYVSRLFFFLLADGAGGVGKKLSALFPTTEACRVAANASGAGTPAASARLLTARRGHAANTSRSGGSSPGLRGRRAAAAVPVRSRAPRRPLFRLGRRPLSAAEEDDSPPGSSSEARGPSERKRARLRIARRSRRVVVIAPAPFAGLPAVAPVLGAALTRSPSGETTAPSRNRRAVSASFSSRYLANAYARHSRVRLSLHPRRISATISGCATFAAPGTRDHRSCAVDLTVASRAANPPTQSSPGLTTRGLVRSPGPLFFFWFWGVEAEASADASSPSSSSSSSPEKPARRRRRRLRFRFRFRFRRRRSLRSPYSRVFRRRFLFPNNTPSSVPFGWPSSSSSTRSVASSRRSVARTSAGPPRRRECAARRWRPRPGTRTTRRTASAGRRGGGTSRCGSRAAARTARTRRKTDRDRRRPWGAKIVDREESGEESGSKRRLEPTSKRRLEPIPTRRLEPTSKRRREPIPTRRLEPIPTRRLEPIPKRRLEPMPTRRLDPPGLLLPPPRLHPPPSPRRPRPWRSSPPPAHPFAPLLPRPHRPPPRPPRRAARSGFPPPRARRTSRRGGRDTRENPPRRRSTRASAARVRSDAPPPRSSRGTPRRRRSARSPRA